MDRRLLKNPAPPVGDLKANRRNQHAEAPVRYLLIGGLALALLSGVMMFVAP